MQHSESTVQVYINRTWQSVRMLDLLVWLLQTLDGRVMAVIAELDALEGDVGK